LKDTLEKAFEPEKLPKKIEKNLQEAETQMNFEIQKNTKRIHGKAAEKLISLGYHIINFFKEIFKKNTIKKNLPNISSPLNHKLTILKDTIEKQVKKQIITSKYITNKENKNTFFNL
jgi:hypothetical protein